MEPFSKGYVRIPVGTISFLRHEITFKLITRKPQKVVYRTNKHLVINQKELSIVGIVSKEIVCCVGGKVKHLSRLSTTSIVGIVSKETGAASVSN